jgi:hypothetical protein
MAVVENSRAARRWPNPIMIPFWITAVWSTWVQVRIGSHFVFVFFVVVLQKRHTRCQKKVTLVGGVNSKDATLGNRKCVR